MKSSSTPVAGKAKAPPAPPLPLDELLALLETVLPLLETVVALLETVLPLLETVLPLLETVLPLLETVVGPLPPVPALLAVALAVTLSALLWEVLTLLLLGPTAAPSAPPIPPIPATVDDGPAVALLAIPAVEDEAVAASPIPPPAAVA